MATQRNPFAIERFGCSGSIECNWSGATTITAGLAGGVAAAPFRAGSLLSVAPGNPLRFSQITASPSFSLEGTFSGKTIGQVAGELRTGTLTPSQVPVEFVTRNGVDLIVNTRSSLALRRANIPTNQWNLINRTGDLGLQQRITQRLLDNKLTNQGTDVLRITRCSGLGPCSSLN